MVWREKDAIWMGSCESINSCTFSIQHRIRIPRFLFTCSSSSFFQFIRTNQHSTVCVAKCVLLCHVLLADRKTKYLLSWTNICFILPNKQWNNIEIHFKIAKSVPISLFRRKKQNASHFYPPKLSRSVTIQHVSCTIPNIHLGKCNRKHPWVTNKFCIAN